MSKRKMYVEDKIYAVHLICMGSTPTNATVFF